jgi:phytoene dehydrogenase-like protein
LLELSDNNPVKFIKATEVNSYCKRIEGGVNALVQAIYQRIPTINIDLNTRATAIKRNEDQTFTVTAVNNRTEKSELMMLMRSYLLYRQDYYLRILTLHLSYQKQLRLIY